MSARQKLLLRISWTLTLKSLLVLVSLFAFFSLLNNHLLLTPSLTYPYHPGATARVISPDEPATILRTADPNLRWKLTTDTLPFQVTVPRAIERIRVRGELQPGSQPVVWLRAAGAQDVDMTTLVSSSFLDTLEWPHVTDGTMTLWMRDKRVTTETKTEGTGANKKETTSTWEKNVRQYTSVDEFTTDPPDLGVVATTGLNRLALASMNGVDLPAEGVTWPQIFRGSHQFYVYAPGGELKIAFDKVDRNRGNDADPLTVRIARADELDTRRSSWIKTLRVKDDGNSKGNGPTGDPQRVELVIPDAKAGAYFVDIVTSEDVVLTNLTSSSAMVSFIGRVFLAEGPAYGEKYFRPLTLLTNGTRLTMAAAHEQGKQDVMIAGKKYALKGINVEVVASELNGITSLQIGRPDVKISSDGLITIAPAKIFPSTGARPLDLSTTPNLDDVDYVFVAYQPNTKKTITFDETYAWSELELKGKRLSFVLEAPGLQTTGSTLALSELKATLIRGPFPWNKVWDKTVGRVF